MDANGAGMMWSWQTGYFSIDDGEDFIFIDTILPDFVLDWVNAPPQITLELLGVNYPISLPTTAPTVFGPYVVNTGAASFVPCRVRARQVALAASGSDLGTFNRIGAIRMRFSKDGRDN
jgi:hypothetical protein